MKKLFIIAAAVATLASCTNNEPINIASTQDGAISFGAYTGSTVATKGTVTTSKQVYSGGFGVFAFYQPATKGNFNSKKYATPDFMYNQKVTGTALGSRLMTLEERYEFNKELEGARTMDMSNPAHQNVYYTEEEVNAYNKTLPGALKMGDVTPGPDSELLADEASANEYNETLTGAIHTTTVKTPGRNYTMEECEEHNATLEGAATATSRITVANELGDYTGSKCTYDPVKYWPNNVGDKLSFFAYAPYKPGAAWDDINIKTDAANTKLTASFSISDEVKTQEDLLWANPVLNKSNKNADNANILGTSNVNFDFTHVTAKVDLHIGVAQVAKTADGPTAWNDVNTDIEIKSIVFNDIYDGFDFVYTIADDGTLTSPTSNNENAAKFSLTVKPCTAAATISDGWTAGYHKYLDADEFMFLAPQEFTDETVVITYTVKTGEGINGSEITNVIEKKMSEIFADGKLVAGSAYNINFLIGMDDVNITSSLVDWSAATDSEVFVPGNVE